MSDRHDWPTAEIIRAYHGQSAIEAVFAHLMDPNHIALRPQRHWTDQKLHVHVFTCVLGYLLARLLLLRVRRANSPYTSVESLLDALAKIRRVTVIRRASEDSKPRLSTQLEDLAPEELRLMEVLKIAA